MGRHTPSLVDGVTDYKGDEKPAGPTDTFLLPAWSHESTEAQAVQPSQGKAPPPDQR